MVKNKKMKILALTRYARMGASSRLRFYAFQPLFKKKNIDLDIRPFFSNKYLQKKYNKQNTLHEIIKGYAKRIFILFQIRKYDLIWIEKEIFPFIPWWIETCTMSLAKFTILDFDDATFHQYSQSNLFWVRKLLGDKIRATTKAASMVFCGNHYLRNVFKKYGAKNVHYLPTLINCKKYFIKKKFKTNPRIGWIGTPETTFYLKNLLPVFKNVKKKVLCDFVAIGADSSLLPKNIVKTIPWSEKSEVKEIQKFSCGIMPLVPGPWEKGKCGYKLLQYMACGIPVIASNVGFNKFIVSDSKTGFLARNELDWEKYIIKFCKMGQERTRMMGRYARMDILTKFSLETQGNKFVSNIKKALEI